MPPTPANVRYVERLAAEIHEKIRLGLFSVAEYFPAAGDTAQVTTLADQLDSWLRAQRIESSTRAGYGSATRFWKEALPDKALRAVKHVDVLTALAVRPELSGKTVNNYVSVLREALALDVRDGLLQSTRPWPCRAPSIKKTRLIRSPARKRRASSSWRGRVTQGRCTT